MQPTHFDIMLIWGDDTHRLRREGFGYSPNAKLTPADLKSIMERFVGVFDPRYSIPNQDDGRSTVLIYDRLADQELRLPLWALNAQPLTDSFRQIESSPPQGQRTESFSTVRSAQTVQTDSAGHGDDCHPIVFPHLDLPNEDPGRFLTDLGFMETPIKAEQNILCDSVLPETCFDDGSAIMSGDADGRAGFGMVSPNAFGIVEHIGRGLNTETRVPCGYNLGGPSMALRPSQLTTLPNSGFAFNHHAQVARAQLIGSNGWPTPYVEQSVNSVGRPTSIYLDVPQFLPSQFGHFNTVSPDMLAVASAVKSEERLSPNELTPGLTPDGSTPSHEDPPVSSNALRSEQEDRNSHEITPSSPNAPCSEREGRNSHSRLDDNIAYTPLVGGLSDTQILHEKFTRLGDVQFRCNEGGCMKEIKGTRSCPRHWKSRHSSYKAYRCKLCNALFKRQDHAKRHLRTCSHRNHSTNPSLDTCAAWAAGCP